MTLTVNFQPQNFPVRYDFVLLAIWVSLVFDFRVSDTYGTDVHLHRLRSLSLVTIARIPTLSLRITDRSLGRTGRTIYTVI